MEQIPGMLSTSYRCLQCQKTLKKSEVEEHKYDNPTHEIYKSKQEIDFEVIREEVKEPTIKVTQKSYSEIEKLRQENKVLRKHIEEEILAMELLSLKLKRIRRMYESTIR